MSEVLEFEQRPSLAPDETVEPTKVDAVRVAPGKVARTTRLFRDARGPRPNGPLAGVLSAAAASRGKPLPAELRRRLELALRTDLSAVRVHTGDEAATAAKALAANAFTVGTDVFFAAGAFDPQTDRGQRLIAHEMAHVAQTGGAGPSLHDVDHVDVSDPGEHAELDAHAFADAFVDGRSTARGPDDAPRPTRTAPDAAPATSPTAAPTVAHRGPATTILRDAAPGAAAPTVNSAAPAMTPQQQAELERALSAVPTTPPAVPHAPAATPPTAHGHDHGHGHGNDHGPGHGAQGHGAQGHGAQANGGQARRGGGGGSTTPPAPAGGDHAPPAPTPSPDAAPRAPGSAVDGLVDYYMETHWSDARFMGLVAENGYPGSAPKNVVSELDRWMPTNTPPSVRSTVNLVAGVGLGIFDSLFWSGLKAMPVAGVVFSVIDTFRQGAEAVGKYQEVGDWGGGAMAVLRAICDGGASIADNVSNVAGFIESACFIIAGVLGIGAVATALAGVGVAVGAVAAAVASIGATAKLVKVVARLISAALNAIKVVLDYVLLLTNAAKAEEAEANGDFAKAAKYRQLMQGNAVDTVTDSIATIGDTIEGIIGVLGFGSGPSTIMKIGTKIGGEALGVAADTGYKWFKHGSRLVGGLTGGAARSDGINGAVGGAGGAFDDLMDHDINMPIMVPGIPVPVGSQVVNLADQMRTSDRYTDPGMAAGGSGPIAAARQQTVAHLNASQQGLGNEPISWYQKLVNEILTPPPNAPNTATGIADAMKPSTQIMNLLGGMRNLLGMVSGGSLDSIANAADTAAGWANSLLQPAIGKINQFLSTAKPRMQQMLEHANQQIQQSQLNLERVRGIITTFERGAAKVQEITGQNGVIEQKYQELMTKADGWRVTRASIGLPASINIPLVGGSIDAAINRGIAGVNSTVDGFKAAVTAVKTAIIDRITTALTQGAQWVQQKMQAFNRQLSEGGAAHTAMTTQYNNFKRLFDRATQLFAQWDGRVPDIDLSGAGNFLRQVAAASRRAKEIESGARPDPWKDIARTEGQTFVNSWRSAHGDQIRTLYQPRPDPAEMAAVSALYNSVRPRATGAAAERLEAAYARCQQAAGQPGRRALYALWAAENDLIAAAAAVPAHTTPAPAPGTTPRPGGPPPPSSPDDATAPGP